MRSGFGVESWHGNTTSHFHLQITRGEGPGHGGWPYAETTCGSKGQPYEEYEVTPEGTQKGIDRHVTVRALPRGEVQQILLLMRFLDSSHCVRVPPPFGQVISE
jgi:hypothetical protein